MRMHMCGKDGVGRRTNRRTRPPGEKEARIIWRGKQNKTTRREKVSSMYDDGYEEGSAVEL
jgi:hypothetical protein